MIIKTTKFAIGELSHKIRIVADEEDLQESYTVTAAQAEAVCLRLMKFEREGVVIDTDAFKENSVHVLEMLQGEADDASVVLRDIGKTEPDRERKATHAKAREMYQLATALDEALGVAYQHEKQAAA